MLHTERDVHPGYITVDTLSRPTDSTEATNTKVNDDMEVYVGMITSLLPRTEVKMELIKS